MINKWVFAYIPVIPLVFFSMENANEDTVACHIGLDASDVDILNDSLHNLSLEGKILFLLSLLFISSSFSLLNLTSFHLDEAYFESLTASTPVKSKRRLESRPSECEPPSKRLCGGESKKRQGVLQSRLKENFAESPGKKTDRSEVMSFLETNSKSLATRAVKSTFPSATYDKRKQQYRNVRKSVSFVIGGNESVSQNTEVYKLQQNVLIHKQKAKLLMDDIVSNSSVSDNVYLGALVNMYNKEIESISKLSDSIDAIYERELNLLLNDLCF